MRGAALSDRICLSFTLKKASFQSSTELENAPENAIPVKIQWVLSEALDSANLFSIQCAAATENVTCCHHSFKIGRSGPEF